MALATKRKPTTHHKKRTAKHHRHSKDYLKHYWPYLPMLLVVVVGLAINNFWTARSQVLGATSDFSSQALVYTTNTVRRSENRAPLTLDAQLTAAAQAKANDMVANNYWSHNAPDGETPWTFIEAAGYTYEKAGENLAYGFTNASQTITGWMNSPEHRANILNSTYTNVGFGVATSPNFQKQGPSTIVVALYGKPLPAVASMRFTVPEPSGTVTSKTLGVTQSAQPDTQLVSRIQILTGGQAPWSMFVLTSLASGGLIFLLMRHGFRLRRLITQGEMFVVHHPILDITVVAIVTIGFVLTRSSGFIR